MAAFVPMLIAHSVGGTDSMGILTIQCPRTGYRVSTGIEVDRLHFDRMREARFTVQCWKCGGEHAWSKRWATWSADDPDHGDQSAGQELT